MIEGPTDNQIDAMRDRWIKQTCTTETCDKLLVEKAIKALYDNAGIHAPERVIWCQSPISMLVAFALVTDSCTNKLKDTFDKVSWSNIEKLANEASCDKSALTSPSVKEYSLVPVINFLREHLPNYDSAWKALEPVGLVHVRLKDFVSNRVGLELWNTVKSALVGPDNAQLLAVSDLLQKTNNTVILKNSVEEKVRNLTTLERSVGWMLCQRKICWVSERPVISTDSKGRLHSENGPALSYSDGVILHALNGVIVPRKVVEAPENYTESEIRGEGNSEVVRLLAERLGWAQFVVKLGARQIDTWTDPLTKLSYELLDTESEEPNRWRRTPRFLKMVSPVVHDGTSPSYIEPVDPGLKTAQAARKWQLHDWPTSDPAGLVTFCNTNPVLNFEQEA